MSTNLIFILLGKFFFFLNSATEYEGIPHPEQILGPFKFSLKVFLLEAVSFSISGPFSPRCLLNTFLKELKEGGDPPF